MKAPIYMTKLWNWSLDVYKSADTQRACLYLQNTWSLDVNTLLWLCWLAEHNHIPTSRAIDAADTVSKYWQSTLIFNVRRARKRINVTHQSSGSQLKTQLLKLELSREKRQQHALEQLSSKENQGIWEHKYKICQNNLDMLLASRCITMPACARATDDLCRSIFSENGSA